MGLFDDLIPRSAAPSGTGLFDDLIPKSQQSSTLGDIARSGLAGVERGAIGLAGLPGDVRDIALSALPKPPAPQPAPSAYMERSCRR